MWFSVHVKPIQKQNFNYNQHHVYTIEIVYATVDDKIMPTCACISILPPTITNPESPCLMV